MVAASYLVPSLAHTPLSCVSFHHFYDYKFLFHFFTSHFLMFVWCMWCTHVLSMFVWVWAPRLWMWGWSWCWESPWISPLPYLLRQSLLVNPTASLIVGSPASAFWSWNYRLALPLPPPHTYTGSGNTNFLCFLLYSALCGIFSKALQDRTDTPSLFVSVSPWEINDVISQINQHTGQFTIESLKWYFP